MASLRAAVERIDSAKVYSDLDLDIYDLYETWHFSYGQLDTPLEELVEQTISHPKELYVSARLYRERNAVRLLGWFTREDLLT